MRHHRPIKTMRSWLTETRWMRVLPEPVRERVLAEAHEVLHAERAFVAHQGEPSGSWIGVAEGLLKASSGFASGKTLIFSGIPAGSWIGEGSVLKRELRHYDIVAVQPSRTVHIPRATRAGCGVDRGLRRPCEPADRGLSVALPDPRGTGIDHRDVVPANRYRAVETVNACRPLRPADSNGRA